MQFGAKPLFENVSVKFGGGNRYGLIGANGCGKSTFMKILGRDLEPTAGNVMVDSGERVGKLRQDQFAFEDCFVIDTVLMGHTELWRVKQERDAIYANPDATEDDYMHAAELESQFAELNGYSAEARAGELLLGVGIPSTQHHGLMSAIAPGFKLRVLLAQALFSDPEILLLDEPTNNLDINTIRWLEDVINASKNTKVKGNVELRDRAQVLIQSGANVIGNVQTDGAYRVRILNSNINGDVQLTGIINSLRSLILHSHVGGTVDWNDNQAPFLIQYSDVDSDVKVNQNNRAAGVYDNVIGGNLQCQSNTPAPKGARNVVDGNKEDQCARF